MELQGTIPTQMLRKHWRRSENLLIMVSMLRPPQQQSNCQELLLRFATSLHLMLLSFIILLLNEIACLRTFGLSEPMELYLILYYITTFVNQYEPSLTVGIVSWIPLHVLSSMRHCWYICKLSDWRKMTNRELMHSTTEMLKLEQSQYLNMIVWGCQSA